MTNTTGNLAAPTEKRRCTAKTKQSGGTDQCVRWALKGQTVCRVHGGAAPQALAAAERRMAEERARGLVATYGRPIETTATQALLDEVRWTAGHVAWLRDRVQEIEARSAAADGDHPLVWGVTKQTTGGEHEGITEEAAPNIWLKLYQQERTHLVRVCSEALRAGIEERRVQLAEQQGLLVAQVIRGILSELGLTDEQQARVPQVVPRHLRALTA